MDMKIHPSALSGLVVRSLGEQKPNDQETAWPLFFSNHNNNVKRDFGHLVFGFWSPTFVQKLNFYRVQISEKLSWFCWWIKHGYATSKRLWPHCVLGLAYRKVNTKCILFDAILCHANRKIMAPPHSVRFARFSIQFFSNTYMLVQFLNFVFFCVKMKRLSLTNCNAKINEIRKILRYLSTF